MSDRRSATTVGAARRRAPRVPRRRARPTPRRRPRPDDGPRHGDTHGEYRLFGPRPAPFGPRLHGLVPATERLRHGRRRVRSVRRWSRGESGRRDVLCSGRRSVGRRRRGECHCSRGPEHDRRRDAGPPDPYGPRRPPPAREPHAPLGARRRNAEGARRLHDARGFRRLPLELSRRWLDLRLERPHPTARRAGLLRPRRARLRGATRARRLASPPA
mmetsp:Transcript_20489/g.53369  ORF Transcript_20489/g.53369 Transcript_20489/m.53369 type:complete len:216 (-) Transcript_20489:106-753(-)